jgi:hypothetical protein
MFNRKEGEEWVEALRAWVRGLVVLPGVEVPIHCHLKNANSLMIPWMFGLSI